MSTLPSLHVPPPAGLILASPSPALCPFVPCRPFYYFLVPSYWFPSRFVNNQLNRINDSMGPSVNPGSVDSDVAEEEAKMRTLLHHRTGGGQ